MSKLVVAAAMALVLAGCGGDDCPDTTGVWKIVQHCDPSLLNQTVTVVQTGCTVVYNAPFDGWSATVAPGGLVKAYGPPGANQITCDGTVLGSTFSLACTPPCQVTLQKQ